MEFLRIDGLNYKTSRMLSCAFFIIAGILIILLIPEKENLELLLDRIFFTNKKIKTPGETDHLFNLLVYWLSYFFIIYKLLKFGIQLYKVKPEND